MIFNKFFFNANKQKEKKNSNKSSFHCLKSNNLQHCLQNHELLVSNKINKLSFINYFFSIWTKNKPGFQKAG